MEYLDTVVVVVSNKDEVVVGYRHTGWVLELSWSTALRSEHVDRNTITLNDLKEVREKNRAEIENKLML